MLTIRAMSDGKGYSARHLEHNDYYAEGERVVGHWQGRGAGLLGLSGSVKSEEFEAVRQGLDPNTGDFLRVRRSADREAADGSTMAKGRSLYDFTFSAPKSVSVMALVGNDHRLIDAHKNAVAEALGEVEAVAASRVRKARANEDRTTGNLVLAVYHHDTSRELDPQLHTHAVAANLTFDGVEGRWKVLQATAIYDLRAYLTEVYRNALARKLHALGYEIDSHRDAKGRDSGFEIRGARRELLEKFSQRSRQRDEAIENFTRQHKRPPTDNEVAVLVRESRAAKLIEISTGELRHQQRSRLTSEDVRHLAEVHKTHPIELRAESAEPSLQHAKEHIFERVSVAPTHDILAEALRHGRGRIRLRELNGDLAHQESAGHVLRNGSELATAESLRRERDMIAAVNRGIGAFEPLGDLQEFIASDRLRPEQKRAVEFALQSRDRVVGISGAAGTGKTATLQELGRGLMEAGRAVIAVAPTMSAVEELQKVGFANAVTIERLLQDTHLQAEVDHKVVILDEAGMVSARQMADFLRLAERRSCRIIFSGDTKQIQSVEAGDALRILEQESQLKSVPLTQVQRQTNTNYRDAIEELRRCPERGFAKLDAIGAVREVTAVERAQAVAEAYVASGERNSLVVCATHDEIDRVTAAIRERRKSDAKSSNGVVLRRHVSLNWTLAQKADFKNYQCGQVLVFHRAVKGIVKNAAVEVVSPGDQCVVVRTADGMERTITRKQAHSFDVLETRPIEVAGGDRLLLTANRCEPGYRVTNGEIVAVVALNSDGGIRLEDGRTLPAGYRHFTHGYAVTAHRSQGRSVDSVIISADGMQKELFYVAASRGRRSVTVITSDKNQLKESVARSMARKSASELARTAHPAIHRAAHRGLSTARELVRRAAQFVTSVPQRLVQHTAHKSRNESQNVSLSR